MQTYGLVSGYNENGAGDSLPGNDSNAEYTLIFPKMATDSFEYDVTFPKFCSATNDSILDLRFDFQWVVLQEASVIHFYDPEESILLQGLVKREMGEINYLLGSPTCMTENQVLWALVQNPGLGTPSDYGLGNRVVGGGGVQTVDYLSLAERVLQTRATFPRGPTDTEVLYVAGLQQNYDVLGKIRLQGIAEPTFEDLHEGDFETFFSYYSVTDVYDQFKIGDPEIQGEQKILYLTYWYNGAWSNTARVATLLRLFERAKARVLPSALRATIRHIFLPPTVRNASSIDTRVVLTFAARSETARLVLASMPLREDMTLDIVVSDTPHFFARVHCFAPPAMASSQASRSMASSLDTKLGHVWSLNCFPHASQRRPWTRPLFRFGLPLHTM